MFIIPVNNLYVRRAGISRGFKPRIPRLRGYCRHGDKIKHTHLHWMRRLRVYRRRRERYVSNSPGRPSGASGSAIRKIIKATATITSSKAQKNGDQLFHGEY